MNIAICDDDRVIIEQIEEFLQIIHDKSLEYEVFFCAEELQKYITENNVNFDVFETVTFDFIQKPLTFEKIKNTLEKTKNYLEIKRRSFVFSYKKNNYNIAFSDICYLEKDGRKVWIYTIDDKKYQCNMTLKEIWSQLDDEMFGMLNKSLIVNLSKIEGIIGENVILQDDRMLYVSRDYRKEIKKKHLNYLRGQVWI